MTNKKIHQTFIQKRKPTYLSLLLPGQQTKQVIPDVHWYDDLNKIISRLSLAEKITMYLTYFLNYRDASLLKS